MTNEELVLQIQQGIDVSKNLETLWRQNYKFFNKCTNRYTTKTDDLLQEGFLGLCEAVKHYDPERGVKFLTYAGYYIQAYSLHNKKELKALDVAWLDEPIVIEDGKADSLADFLVSCADVENEAVNNVQAEQIGAVLWPMLDKLPEKIREVFILLYQKNMSKNEIALELGCSYSRVYQLYSDGLVKLRRPENLMILRRFRAEV